MPALRCLTLTVFVCIFSLTSVFAQGMSDNFSAAAAPDYGLTAKSAILIEASTGRVIFEKNADAREYPASMTKMMTALLSLEMSKPEDIVHIADEAADVDGSSLYLQKGDIMRMDELRQGMMLVSGNDAAVAIADAISGSTAAFTDVMNAKAAEIGADNTHFANPNGLPNPSHYSTARDMAKIADYAYKNRDFREIVAAKEKEIHWISPNKKEIVDTTNRLLWDYPYANGIKTGYTDDAGGCLAASATRDGVTLIAVVMHTEAGPDRFTEAQELLNYGFNNVRLQPAYKKSDLMQSVHVHGGETAKINILPQSDIIYPVLSSENSSSYSIKINMPRYLEAPVKMHDKVGSVDILYDNKKVGEVPIIADSSSDSGFSFQSLYYAVYDSIAGFFVA